MKSWKLWLSLSAGCGAAVLAGVLGLSLAQEAGKPEAKAGEKVEKIELPKPKEAAGVDLLAAIKGRHTTRDYDAAKPIPEEVLATVLWAADGVNRANGKHTAPTALGVRHMRIYVCRADGAWRYDQDAHVLLAVTKDDLRGKIGVQKFVADAQAVIVLTSDLSAFDAKAARADAERRREWSHCAAGAIAQNVYLAAEAFGLGTVIAGGVNAEVARKSLELKADEVPLYIMPLGYPK